MVGDGVGGAFSFFALDAGLAVSLMATRGGGFGVDAAVGALIAAGVTGTEVAAGSEIFVVPNAFAAASASLSTDRTVDDGADDGEGVTPAFGFAAAAGLRFGDDDDLAMARA